MFRPTWPLQATDLWLKLSTLIIKMVVDTNALEVVKGVSVNKPMQ
jgi:hypothetical protein